MKLKIFLATLLLSAATVFADIPKAGDTAPSFEGTDQDGKDVKLSDFAGKNLLPYFVKQYKAKNQQNSPLPLLITGVA